MTELKMTVSEDLLHKVIKKYHYREEDAGELRQVAHRMEAAMRGRSGFWCRLPQDSSPGEEPGPGAAEAVMTLGEGIDRLQEEYAFRQKFCECYMAEALGNELLLDCYVRFNDWIASQTPYHVAGYRFFGSREELPLEGMRDVLVHFRETAVKCNEVYCLQPKMSVVFLAGLTADADRVCEGICAGCGCRSCSNRMAGEKEASRRPDMPKGLLPYGYARILTHSADRIL